MTTAVAAIPMLVIASAGIDYLRTSRVAVKLQTVADGAALAAATATKTSGTAAQQQQQRTIIASRYLSQSLKTLDDAHLVGSPEVTVSPTSVKISLKAEIKGSFMNVINALPKSAEIGSGGGGDAAGGVKTQITINSTASIKSTRFTCLLALNATASDALALQGTADVVAPECAVQANSTSNSAISTSGSATIKAKSICSGGNVSGAGYTPMPKTSCPVIADPYSGGFSTDYSATYGSARTVSSSRLQLPAGTTSLQPGIYVGGIRASQGNTADLAPGIYFMKDGALEVRSGGVIRGTGVTIIFTGNSSSYLDVQGGGSLQITAPSSGSFAGMAIASHPSVAPSRSSTVTGGGTVAIEGVAYFPKQTLTITGSGTVSTGSKQFSMVADKFVLNGTGQLTIGQAADNVAAGLPALLTQTNDKGGALLQ